MTITMYATASCPFCRMARALLERKGVAWDEIAVDHEPERREEMRRLSGRHTVPQIFLGEQAIGGFDELMALERRGELDGLLAEQ